MRKFTLLAILAIVVSCGDDAIGPGSEMAPDGLSAGISDAVSGVDNNPGFWWLAPMVPQPTLSGVFQSAYSPRVTVVCQYDNDPAAVCDPHAPLVSGTGVPADFTRGTGLTVEPDHFQVNFDTRAFALRTTSPGDTTTYRVVVESDPLTEFGGPFVLGYADFQLGENGGAAKNLAVPDSMIGLVDGRTLPVKFFINEVAYPFELQDFAAEAPAGQETFCAINCSVTVLTNTETTEASLPKEDGSGSEVVSLLFQAGDLASRSVLVLDEREEGPDGNCAPTINLKKLNCVRGAIVPDLPFNNDVRFGLSRCNVPLGPGSHYVIKKDDEGQLTEPPQDLDVSDFFTDDCGPLQLGFAGGARRLARAALDFFVPPAFAGDSTRAGGTIRSLSDLFWAEDAHASTTIGGGQSDAGAVFSLPITIVNEHQDPDVPLSGQEVIYSVTSRVGQVAAPGGTPGAGPLTLLTGSDGTAAAELTLGAGTNVVVAETPTALGGPFTFTFNGLGLISHWDAEGTTPFADETGPNDAQATASVAIGAGVTGTAAYAFDGSGGVVTAGTEDFGDSDLLTVASWVYLDPAGPADAIQRFVSIGNKAVLRQNNPPPGTGRQAHFYMSFGPDDGTGNSLHHITANGALTAGCWQHVAGTFDGTEMRLFINGQLAGSLPIDAALASQSASSDHIVLSSDFLGNESDPAGEALYGRLDDVRVYNKAATQGEIQNVMALASPPSCSVASVEVAPGTAEVLAGGTVQLDPTLRDAAGNELVERPVQWTSLNPAVVTVDQTGLVTAVAPGSAEVLATSEGVSGSAFVTVVENGLLLHYAFDGDATNSGPLSGYDGTVTSVTFPAGKSGQAIKFDGTAGTGATLTGTSEVFARGGSDWTISLWFREDQKQPESLLWDFRAPARGWQTYHGTEELPDQRMITCSDGGCFSFISGEGAWHNIVYRYDGVSATVGGPVQIFVDGMLTGELPNTGSLPLVGAGVTDIRLGNLAATSILGPSVFYVDDFRIYNVVFTPQDQCTVVVGGTWNGTTCTLP